MNRSAPMRLLGRAGFSALLLLAALAWGQDEAPAQEAMRAQYRLSYDGIPMGEVEETWERHGDHYRLRSVAKPYPVLDWVAPTFNETSTGTIVDSQLRPDHFVHQRSDQSEALVADFDWKEGKLTNQFNGRTETLPLQPGTQDMLSIKYLLRIAGGRALNVTIPLTTGKRLETHHLVLAGHESIETPRGTLLASHIVDKGQSDEARFELWMSDDARDPPLRMVVHERGNRWEQRLIGVTYP